MLTRILVPTLILGCAVGAFGQSPTLAQRVATQQSDVSLNVNVDGPMPTVTGILTETDVLVRGIIGKVTGHLSSDGRDVFTTYELLSPKVVFSSRSPRIEGAAGAETLTLVQHGGTVRINGWNASVLYDDMATLSPDMEVVAFLRDAGGQYRASGGGAAIFQVRNNVIVPLVRRSGEHKAFAGADVDTFMSDMVGRKRFLQAK
jgi:hypothetical protein